MDESNVSLNDNTIDESSNNVELSSSTKTVAKEKVIVSPKTRKEIEKEKLLQLSEALKSKITKNISKWKKKYNKSGNIPKSMKKFCKENRLSRIAAKTLLKSSDPQDLLYKNEVEKEEEEKESEEISLLSTEVLPPPNENSIADNNTVVARRDSLDEILQEDNIPLDKDVNPDVYENIELDDLIENSADAKDTVEMLTVVEETVETLTVVEEMVVENITLDNNEYDVVKDDEIVDDDAAKTNIENEDDLFNIEEEDYKDIEPMNIPSVNDLFDQIMNDLQLTETLEVIEESAVILENQPPPREESQYALREEELATTTVKGEELKFSDMSEFDSSTVEGMSMYVENIAENMLEMLESNAREVMKYEGEVISEIGDVEYTRPWWAENDVNNHNSNVDPNNMALVPTENNDNSPVTLNLVCEKLKLATSQFQGSRIQSNANANAQIDTNATTKRFDNIMAITKRATQDFCSGVRTEFRRLVDEITESRAFIQRLEKMLGEEIEQKVNLGNEKSEELKEAERQLRLMEQRERSRMMTLASMKRALKDQMQDVRVMLDQRVGTITSKSGNKENNDVMEDVS